MGLRVNTEVIKGLYPCRDGLDSWIKFYGSKDISLLQFLIGCKKIKVSHKIWLAIRLLPRRDVEVFAISCAADAAAYAAYAAAPDTATAAATAACAAAAHAAAPATADAAAAAYACAAAATAADAAAAYAAAAYAADAAAAYAAYAAAAYAAYAAAHAAAEQEQLASLIWLCKNSKEEN